LPESINAQKEPNTKKALQPKVEALLLNRILKTQ